MKNDEMKACPGKRLLELGMPYKTRRDETRQDGQKSLNKLGLGTWFSSWHFIH